MPELDPVAASVPLPSLASAARGRYRVFISYSHADTKWARWLMRRLEGFSVPRRFHGLTAPIGIVDRRIAPVFRDRDELPTTSDLGETICTALQESATLVVICSPASARSRWVHEEIATFKRLHGERGVFAFIVSGEPKVAGAADDCFSPALRSEVEADGELSDRPVEVVAADARAEGDGPKMAFVRLVAGLLGVGFDELRQRELQRRNRRLVILTACSAMGMAITLGLAAVAWRARNDARRRQEQAEDVLGFMLGSFRSELKKVGRMDLLDHVGDKAMDYFEHLDARDLTDTALARQAKALTQIGEIRMEQKDVRYADAARSFRAAYDRARSLTTKHPGDADMLFERAQAEFGIGFVYWKRRDAKGAVEWLTGYRDSALDLKKLEGSTLRARREVVSGHHNLAVVEFGAGRVSAARAGFLAELAAHRELLTANPNDRAIAFRVADTLSWLGSTAEAGGDLREAAQRYGEQVEEMDALCRADPKTAHWRYKLAESKARHAIVLGVTGRLLEAQEQLSQARAQIADLLRLEPANRRWQVLALTIRLQSVVHAPEHWPESETIRLVEGTRREIEKLAQAEPTDVELARLLTRAWRLEAVVRFAAGEPDAAVAARQALAQAESLLSRDNQPDIRGACADVFLLAARVAASAGDTAAARDYCERVLQMLPVEESRHWRELDAAARAFALLGREAEHRALAARLEAMGCQPIEPPFTPILSATKTSNQK